MFCRWKSPHAITADEVGCGETDVIKKLIKRLQHQYGKHLVYITVSLLTVTTYGITAQDMRDLLVNRDSVKIEVLRNLQHIGFQQEDEQDGKDAVSNAIDNCLTLLLGELSDLLHVKRIGGCEVYCWSSRNIENALQSFCDKAELNDTRKSLMEHCMQYVERKSKMPLKEPLKCSHICMELASFSEVPEFQDCISRLWPLSFSCLHTMIHSFGVVQVLCLLEQAYKCSRDRSILVVERAIRLALPVIHRSIHSFSGELFSRLSHFASSFPSIDKLVKESVSPPRNSPSLLPAGIHAQAPGAPLRVSINEQQSISKSVVVYEKESVMCLTYCCCRTLKMFDMHNGDVIREVLFKDDIEWIQMSDTLEVRCCFTKVLYNAKIFSVWQCFTI